MKKSKKKMLLFKFNLSKIEIILAQASDHTVTYQCLISKKKKNYD